jgi:hypothetical protein
VLEKLLAAEVLKVRVLDPTRGELLIGEIESVLEDGEPRHQPGRQGRHARTVAVDRAAPLLDEVPRDRPRQARQFMLHVDDLIETGAEQVLLARLTALAWLHRVILRRIVHRP